MLFQKLLAACTVLDGQMDRLNLPSQGLVSDQENSTPGSFMTFAPTRESVSCTGTKCHSIMGSRTIQLLRLLRRIMEEAYRCHFTSFSVGAK